MATIKDVAARAGVGLGTASRVLSGSTQTSPSSRERVLAAAAELGYVANGPARSLRRARTDALGLLVSDIRNPFFSELAHAAEQEARAHGYAVLLANANEDERQADDVLRTFASQRIDGLMLSPQGPATPQLASLIERGVPIVLLNRRIDGIDLPFFGTDNEQGVGLVLDHLQRRGHRDVAYVGGTPTMSTGVERARTYLGGRAEHGISTDDALVEAGDFQTEGAAAAMLRILDRGVQPTAVFGANGATTVGVLRALRERLGAAAAAAIEVVSFDDFDWFDYASPAITAVRNDASAIGRAAVQGLLALVRGEEAASVRVATTLVDRTGR